MKSCLQCGRDAHENESFCIQCGASLHYEEIIRTCPSCQTVVMILDKYCDHCGVLLPAPPPDAEARVTRSGFTSSPYRSAKVGSRSTDTSPPFSQHFSTGSGYDPNSGLPYGSFATTPIQPAYLGKRRSLPYFLLLGILLLLLIGGGGWWFLTSGHSETPPKDTVTPPSTTSQQTDTNQTASPNDQTDPKAKPEDAAKGKLEKFGLVEAERGKINLPFTLYQVADFRGNQASELVLGTSNATQSKVDILSYKDHSFTNQTHVDIQGQINDINASYAGGGNGRQSIYILTYKKGYGLFYDAAKNTYSSDQTAFQITPLSVAEGMLDGDGKVDTVVVSQNDVGEMYFSVALTSKQQINPVPVYGILRNMFLDNIDGDQVSDLTYLNDQYATGTLLILHQWTGKEFKQVGSSNLGGGLINYYPSDLDGDGIDEMISINSVNNGYEIRIWKWGGVNKGFILLDQSPLEGLPTAIPAPMAADFDGDGSKEILILYAADSKTTEYLLFRKN